MSPLLSKLNKSPKICNQVILVDNSNEIKPGLLTDQELAYFLQRRESKKDLIAFNRYNHWLFIQFITPLAEDKSESVHLEKCRKAGDSLLSLLHEHEISEITLTVPKRLAAEVLAYSEGLLLGSYQFLKYLTDASEKSFKLQHIRRSKFY